jgi:phospholipase/carboxylesterase
MRALVRVPAEGRPTLLLLHGRGGTEGDLVPLADALGPGLGVLAPRGPEPEGGGFAWFRHHRIGVPVEESLDRRLAEVGDWLAGALREAGIAPPVVAVGFSNGGMMAGALGAARPELVGAVALLSSAYPLPPRVMALGGLGGTPVFAGAGDGDPFHPPSVMEAGVRAYRDAGALVEAHTYPGASHEVTQREVADLAAWLAAPPARGAGTA